MERYDLLIKKALLPNGKVKDIAVKSGRFVKIGSDIEAEAGYVINASGKIALPSFANMHTHVPMSLLRGIGADLPLMDWLQKVIWPLEGEFVSPEFVKAGTELGLLEMIKSGTTLFMDMYFYEEEVGKVAKEAGIRAGLGFGILDFPTKVAKTPEEYLKRAREFAESFKGEELVFPVICPHAPYTCSPQTLKKAKELADELGLYLHIHVAETKDEVERIREEYGNTPIRYLSSIDFLSDRVLCAHMVWLDEEEMEIVKERDVKVAHCPESNLKLASGIAPVPEYIRKGIHVCLGTDGSASNDNLDMLEELSTMAKLHKGVSLDAKAIDAVTALKVATQNGFSAVGIRAGRIEEGYEADMILIDPENPHLQPLYDPVAQVVYSAQSSDIDTVICRGKVLMEKRELKTLDEERILYEAKIWGEKIRNFLDRYKG
ncbi:5-methylthioadenosine/S-adenosylhomocysteine deaminase [Hydrogenivirga caldilitoris]|uniref:5-methylthioadenosine/S-adenosylhomocysteine deaminase n=1 Tax=Hydrogenivirga caldilitoris TaxID=246264 RepID=A0A497XR85_9AQUI|nr:amidohydrolase [Hydrogenivirga caldilitoris]RLJ71537.1 5-methylthioadenosine/S-adenosylhomocysteine deaminase [Hydrogenivirga caldilitoris]